MYTEKKGKINQNNKNNLQEKKGFRSLAPKALACYKQKTAAGLCSAAPGELTASAVGRGRKMALQALELPGSCLELPEFSQVRCGWGRLIVFFFFFFFFFFFPMFV